MVTRLGPDARKALACAAQEARRRGDRRLGTDHLLLGLLCDPDSSAAGALGVDLAAARAASDSLDQAALAAVGVNVAHLGAPAPAVFSRRHVSLTSGARAVMTVAVGQARRAKSPRIGSAELLRALLARELPDPAAELLSALAVDRARVSSRLDAST